MSAEVRQAPVHLEEHLLDDVLEVGTRSEHAVRDGRDHGAVLAEQLAESGCVTTLGTLHQLVRYALGHRVM